MGSSGFSVDLAELMIRRFAALVRLVFAMVGVLALLGLLSAGSASAAIPTHNLLNNPGAEVGAAYPDPGGGDYAPPRWTFEYGRQAVQTRYGALGGFPSKAESARIGGGGAFFAGGPRNLNSQITNASIKQVAIFPYDNALKTSVDSGAVQYTLSGCLGGKADKADYVELSAIPFDQNGHLAGTGSSVRGPGPSDRGNQTEFLPEAKTSVVPAGTRSILIRMYFGGSGNYIDGYADNVALRLSPTGSTPPAADCPPVSHLAKPTNPYGTNSAVGLIRVGKLKLKKNQTARLKLVCVRPGTRCKGKLKLATKLPGASGRAQLGSAKFTITDRKSKKVKVKLKRSAANLLAKLSNNKLKKLKVTVTATVGTETTKFLVGVTL